MSTHFVTGLDEHGQKVQQGAESEGVLPQERCDRIAEEFQNLLVQLDISHNDYIRTTESRQKKVVSVLLQDLFDRGEIYQAEYQGFYSTRAEQFLQEKDKVDGKWPEIYGEVTEITEVDPVVHESHMTLIALIDRIRMLDNDLIRLNAKLDMVIQQQKDEKKTNKKK